MSDAYPITTRELVGIGLKELGKTIPILGSVIGAHESVFDAIELNRIRQILDAVMKRLDEHEAKTRQPCVLNAYSGQVLLYGCDQARNDILTESKAKEYGCVIAHYMQVSADLNHIAEVLDSLRKLSAGDLKILYRFLEGGKLWSNRRVDEIIGFSLHINPSENPNVLQEKMASALPHFKRLEGLGVLFLAQSNSGGIIHQIGPLSPYMMMYAYLTPGGIRLVRALQDKP